MKIGIIGAGNIGATIGELWSKSGHQVRYGTRHPKEDGSTVSAEEAAKFGEIIFTAAPYGAWPELAKQIGSSLEGKIVIDAANPYPGRDGHFAQAAIDAGEGAGLPVARLIPQSHLVRAFNSVYWETFKSQAHRSGDLIGVPVAGDNDDAVEIVSQLVKDAGFEPVNFGSLVEARKFDPGTPIYNTGMTGVEIRQTLTAK